MDQWNKIESRNKSPLVWATDFQPSYKRNLVDDGLSSQQVVLVQVDIHIQKLILIKLNQLWCVPHTIYKKLTQNDYRLKYKM